MAKKRINQVFKTQGQPTITYIKRETGKFERQLTEALASKGLLCLLTGSSKTGKTTLYTKVATEKKSKIIHLRCDKDLTAIDLWKKALEKVDFKQISGNTKACNRALSITGKVDGKIGWQWLASLRGEVSLDRTSSLTDTEIRKNILAKPSADSLVPILKYLPFLLVVEDFHHLSLSVQKTILQQWKTFIDNEITAVIVSTTHHAVDIAIANSNLIGRIVHIQLTNWQKDDLQKIVITGFDYLNITLKNTLHNIIVEESVGLPLVTQAVCLKLLQNKSYQYEKQKLDEESFSQDDVLESLHEVAVERFNLFESTYERLTRGPRQKTRKYNTYELILLAFTLDPIIFSLTREELEERIKSLCAEKTNFSLRGSITSTLNALGKLQERLQLQLLEWNSSNQKLFITEPTFLFYLRWRKKRSTPPTVDNVLLALLEDSKKNAE